MRRRLHARRLLLLTPPLLQPNAPYPATPHLTGYLERRGYDVHQRDLSIKVVRDVLVAAGGDQVEELLELLGSDVPMAAKRGASEYLDELALAIRDERDPDFGFSRYAEHLGAAVSRFAELERRVRRRGVLDAPLERHLKAAMAEVRPEVVGVTCPFPGTLVGAFKIARYLRRHYPKVRLLLGGGYVSTELRDLKPNSRAYRYFDAFQLDEGYQELERELGGPVARQVPAFVEPSYRGLNLSEYFDLVETGNPMVDLWNCGRWFKLQMARGCYWHRCAFCDVKLPYIGGYRRPTGAAVADAIERLPAIGGVRRVHFVDEAMPPALVRELAGELLARGLKCEWWGNVRFDRAFTPELARLMARAGCVAVSGGLECAVDRLLKLMNKGITLASARAALRAFKGAGIAVHAYLMYGFPTETREEALSALDEVRRLFCAGLVTSAFWHRFALTVHSPLAASAADFGLKVEPPRSDFAVNELGFVEPGAPDWERLGAALQLALYNYQQGRGLKRPGESWLRLAGRRRRGG